jgi:RNA polymerase sigma factor (sigma-70 family)
MITIDAGIAGHCETAKSRNEWAMSQMNGVIEHLRKAVLLRDGAGRTDGQLLSDYLDGGDVVALAALVRRHGSMVWGVCRRILRNEHDAEDAFQAAFVVLVRRAASILPREMVGNWLYGVAVQTALKARATVAKKSSRERQVTEVPERGKMEPEQSQELQPVLDKQLSLLPEKYRSVIVLCDLEGRTRKEAARQLGVPEGTVAGRLARARTLLAKRLAQQGVALSVGALAALTARQTASASAPASALSSAIKTVSLLAAGQTAATGVLSAKVAALAEGVLSTVVLTKIKLGVTALFTVALIGVGGIGAAYFAAPVPSTPHNLNLGAPVRDALLSHENANEVGNFNSAPNTIAIGQDIGLLYQDAIQRELQLTEEQRHGLLARLEQFVGLQGAVVGKIRESTAKLPKEKDPKLRGEQAKILRDKADELRKPVEAAGSQIAKDLLTPAQQKRLQQIVLREAGIGAFGRDDLKRSIGLTGEQSERIAAILKEFGKARGELFNAAPGRQVQMDTLRELSQEFVLKATAVLTEAQMSNWRELIGEPLKDKPAEQPRRKDRPQEHHGGAGSLLRYDDVVKELQLTDEQSKKAAAGLAVIGKMQASHAMKMQTLSGPERIAKEEEGYNSIDAEGDKLAREVLTPAQLERLKQIEVQHLGFAALFRESVEQTLELTDEQMRSLLALKRRHEAQDSKLRREAGRNANSPETRAKLRELERVTFSEAMATFSDGQKAMWKKLTGAPFEIQWPPIIAEREPRAAGPGGPAPERIRMDRIPAPQSRPGVRTTLLAKNALQQDLKLTDDQLKQLKDRVQDLQKLGRVYALQIQGLPRDLSFSERLAKQVELSKPLIDAEMKVLSDIFTKDQQTRFRQIEIQTEGPSAFGREDVLRALKLSEDQIDKIARVVVGYGNAMRAQQMAPRDGKSGYPFDKMRTVSNEYVEKAVAVLNDEQKKTWKDLIGEPFVEK